MRKILMLSRVSWKSYQPILRANRLNILNIVGEGFAYLYQRRIIFHGDQKNFKELSPALEFQCLQFHYDKLLRSVPHF